MKIQYDEVLRMLSIIIAISQVALGGGTGKHFRCPDGLNGFLPDPVDCKRFYRCLDGRSFAFKCPSSTIYKPRAKRCVRGKCKSTQHGGIVPIIPLRPVTTRPPVRKQGSRCTKNGYIADPNDCKKYFHCVNGGWGYISYHKTCRSGTAFNSRTKQCDAKAMSECGTTRSFVSLPSPFSPSKAKPNNARKLKNPPPSNAKYETIGSSGHTRVKCLSPGKFVDPNDCSKYAHCVDGGWGFVVYYKTCPPGTIFNEKAGKCEDGHCHGSSTNSQSGGTPDSASSGSWATGTKPTMPAPGTSTGSGHTRIQCKRAGKFVDPNDCTKFANCIDGGWGFIVYYNTCPQGAGFNEGLGRCQNGYCNRGSDKTTSEGNGDSSNTDGSTSPSGGSSGSGGTGISKGSPSSGGDHTYVKCISEGKFVDPNYCNKYVHCIKGGWGFKDHYHTCPEGMIFDEPWGSCQKGECPRRPPTTSSPGSGNTDTTSSSGSGGSTNEGGGFKCIRAGKFVDPNNCNEYVHCIRGGWGFIVHWKACPERMIFDEQSGECRQGQCQDNVGVTRPATSSVTSASTDTPSGGKPNKSGVKCQRAGKFVDPNDCTKYVHCVDGGWGFMAHYKTCPPGMVFEETTGVCQKGQCGTSSSGNSKVDSSGSGSSDNNVTPDGWDSGSTTRWDSGTTAGWNTGSSGNSATTGGWDSGTTTGWNSGTTAGWNTGSSGNSATPGGWDSGSTTGWNSGTTTGWNTGTTAGWNTGSSGNSATTGGWDSGTTAGWNTGSTTGWDSGTTAGWNTGSSGNSATTGGWDSGTTAGWNTGSSGWNTGTTSGGKSWWSDKGASSTGSTSITSKPGSTVTCEKEGYFRDPDNCHRFYRCVDWSGKGDWFTKFSFNCPAGLVFDERYDICNWPYAAPSCEGGNEPTTQPMTTGSSSMTTPMTVSPTGTSAWTSSGTPSGTTGSPSGMGDFPCPRTGFFRNPKNCRKFYRCVDFFNTGMSYSIFHFDCPANLVFDERISVCNWPQAAPPCDGGNTTPTSPTTQPTNATTDAGNTTVTEPTTGGGNTTEPTDGNGNTTTGPIILPEGLSCGSTSFKRYPGSCSKYYRCVFEAGNFSLSVYICPDGLVYDEAGQMCVAENETEPCNDIPQVPCDNTTTPGGNDNGTVPDGNNSTTPAPDGGNNTTTPDDGNNTTTPDDGNTTTPAPDGGNNTTTPDDGNSTTPAPDGGNNATTPDGGNSTTPAPDGGNNATTPGDGNTTTTSAPDGGNNATTPDDGNSTTPAPDGGNNATTPDDGNSTTPAPDGGNNATTPDDGNSTTPAPDGGNNATTPDDGNSTTPAPDGGNNATTPDDGNSTTPAPDGGNNATTPGDGNNATTPDDGNSTAMPDNTTMPDGGNSTATPDGATTPDGSNSTVTPDVGGNTTVPDNGNNTTPDNTTEPDGSNTTNPDGGSNTTLPDGSDNTTVTTPETVVVTPGNLYDCPSVGHFEFEFDCIRFYRCTETEEKKLKSLLYRCPEGYIFDKSLLNVGFCRREKQDDVCNKTLPNSLIFRIDYSIYDNAILATKEFLYD